MKKIVGIHQPNFIPWLGYFSKIRQSDAFVILDNVDIVTGTADAITNRTKIKNQQGSIWLTVPMKKGESKKISGVKMDNAQNWKSKHLKTIEMSYGKAPYFKEIYPWICDIYTMETDSMNVFNIEIIKRFCAKFGIETEMYIASELDIRSEDKNQRLVEIIKKIGGNVYLSGNGARSYNDVELFKTNGIELTYTNFSPPVYNQINGEFIAGLSTLDYLMNCSYSLQENPRLFTQ